MPENKPTAPLGYTLVPRDSSIPSFILGAVGPVKEQVSPKLTTDLRGTETIAGATPGLISIYDPSKYTQQVRNHEMAHQFQDTRATGNIPLPMGYEVKLPGGASSSAPMKYQKGSVANYDYGGQSGLQKMIDNHKTIADLNFEQQAEVVADYKQKQDDYLNKVKSGKSTPADLRQMYEAHQIYHPLVQQMANMPKSFSQTIPSIGTVLGIGKAKPLGTDPSAPGLPSYDTPGLGVAPADPLLGGQSQPISGTESRKIGDAKKFPNGKIGHWDGHGWRQAQ